MRNVGASKKIINLLESGHLWISKQQQDELEARVTPGEWFTIQGNNSKFLVYANPHAEGGLLIRVCDSSARGEGWEDVEHYILSNLNMAAKYREITLGRNNNCRLFFGAEDGIPGLVIDCYQNYLIIELNSFGCWIYKDLILDWCNEKFGSLNKMVKTKSNQWEVLPQVEFNEFKDPIHVIDNGFDIYIQVNKMQKMGYYFDHSQNRKRLENLISDFKIKNQQIETGLDLFCYVGSWGLSLLRAGLKNVDFIDQGDFKSNIEENISANSLQNYGVFHRTDVFEFLERASNNSKTYDVIISDPPAMTKRPDQKAQALRGYSRIHLGCLKLAKKGTIFVAASCTSYLTNEEIDQTVRLSAQKLALQIRLLDVGLQQWDHPVKGLKAEGNYIKYLCYIVL